MSIFKNIQFIIVNTLFFARVVMCDIVNYLSGLQE